MTIETAALKQKKREDAHNEILRITAKARHLLYADGHSEIGDLLGDVETHIFAQHLELAAALSEPEQDGWQDISTAPRDGGFLAGNSTEVWAAWHYDSPNWHARYGSRGATHWRPLPSAPSIKRGQ